MAFELHPRLAAGGFEIGRMGGCVLLLKNNALFPWFILVPEIEDVEEPHLLPMDRYLEAMQAQRRVAEFIAHHFQPAKLNSACIGNQVTQLHFHVVGRNPGDPAWPGTVWAFDGKTAYSDEERTSICVAARAFLQLDFTAP